MKNWIAAVCFLLTGASAVVGQKGKFEISNGQKLFDGIANNVKPGDTIFITAGNREELAIENITGTVKKPIIVINKGGKVVINTKKDYGILFGNSVCFKITGTGSDDEYGIEIASTANHGLVVAEFSSCCEADHLDIHHVGYAGIVAKTDPNCSRKDLRYFIMRNLSFHDNFIHDITAEGFYVGYSWYPARDFKCGADSLLYSHEIHGVRIYNNIIRNPGQEGIQLGTGTRDVKIYSNSVYNYGLTNTLWQNHGVQIGQGTTGDFFNNNISTGPAEAISLFGGGNNRVYNNVISNCGASAIYQNDRGALKGTTYQISNNIIINPAEEGITLVSDNTSGDILKDNIIVTKNPEKAIVSTGKMKWDSSGNKIFASVESAGLDVKSLQPGVVKKIAKDFPFAKDSSVIVITDAAPAHSSYSFRVNVKKPSVKIYNKEGMLIDSEKIANKGNRYTIDLSSFSTGIYYISVMTGDKPVELRRVIWKK